VSASSLNNVKTKILVVEDDPHILLGLEEVLKSDGFEGDRVQPGDRALDAVAKQQPALIVLDVMLPGLSGYESASNCRKKSQHAHPDAHGEGTGNRQVVGLDLGADDYVTSRSACANCWRASTPSCAGRTSGRQWAAEQTEAFQIGTASIDSQDLSVQTREGER